MNQESQKRLIIADKESDFYIKKKLFGGSVLAFAHNPKTISEVIVPEGVTEIGDNAFYSSDYKELTKVVLPSSVKKIGKNAFRNCPSLQYVSMPAVTEIGDDAFAENAYLTDVLLSDTLVSIGNGAFRGCTSITELTLASSLKKVGDGAFDGCTSLVIRAKASALPSKSYFSAPIVFNCETNDVASNGKIYVTDNGIKYVISNESCVTAKQSARLASAHIPSHISYKGKNVAVTAIAPESFANLPMLTDLVVEEGVAIMNAAFLNCKMLTSIRIEGKNTIAENVFKGCSSVSSVDIDMSEGSSMCGKHIGYLFGDNPNESKFDVRNVFSPPYGETSTRYYLPYISSLTIRGGELDRTSISQLYHLTELNLEGVTRLSKYFLEGCIRLNRLTVPESIETIDKEAFEKSSVSELEIECIKEGYAEGSLSGCSELSYLSLSFDDNISEMHVGSLFGQYKYDMSYDLPYTDDAGNDNVYRIPLRLKEIEINGSHIPVGAFKGMTSLERVRIYGSISEIGSRTFMDCTNLIEVLMPAGLRTIGESAFENCYSLADFTLPTSLTKMGNAAFRSCESIRNLTIPGALESVSDNAFESCTYLSNVRMMPGITVIGSSAFAYCSELSSVQLPAGLCHIRNYAFTEDVMLSEIDLPDTLVGIGSGAFEFCYSLSRVSIGDNVEYLLDTVFASCSALKEIHISAALEELEYGLFRECASLERITIPKNISKIASTAFDNCENLTDVEVEEGSEHFCIKDGNLYTADGLELVKMFKPIEKGVYRVADGTEVIRSSALARRTSELILPKSIKSSEDIALWHECITVRCYGKTRLNYKSDLAVLNSKFILDAENNDLAEDGFAYAVIDGTRYKITENGAMITTQMSADPNWVIPDKISYKGEMLTVLPPENTNDLDCYTTTLSSITMPKSFVEPKLLLHLRFSHFPIYFRSDANKMISNGLEDTPLIWNCESNCLDENGYEYTVVDKILYALKDDEATAVRIVASVFDHSPIDVPSSVTFKGKEYAVTKLGDNFNFISNVINLPDSVCELSIKSLGAGAYNNGINHINVSENNPRFSTYEGILYDKDRKKLICYPTNRKSRFVRVPNGVEEIGAEAFAEAKNLQMIILPEGLKLIGESAFNGVENVTEIKIPKGVADLPFYSFAYCKNLKTLYIPVTLAKIDSDAFAHTENIENVYCGESKQGWERQMSKSGFVTQNMFKKVNITFDVKELKGL